jgi:hemolysin activation/secretion protein
MRDALTFSAIMLMTAPAAAQTTRDPAAVAQDFAPARAPQDAPMLPVAPPQPGVVESLADTGTLMIGAVQVEGLAAMPREAFAPALGKFLGQPATSATLGELAKAIASAARARGYVFASATVPPQAIRAGQVVVRLDDGRIDAVRLIGTDSKRLKRILDKIVGPAVEREALERALLLAGDVPGVEIVSTQLVREQERAILVVETRARRGDGTASLDNYGTSDVGPVRARLRYDFTGLASDDDVLSIQVVATPVAPRELAYATVRYTQQIGSGGTQVGVSASVGRAQPGVAGERATSISKSVSLFASTPLVRTMATSLWANAELTSHGIDSDGLYGQHDRVVTLAGWLYATTRTGKGRLNLALGVVQGLGVSNTTVAGTPDASRFDGSARFTKGYAATDWTMPLGSGLGVRLSASGQLADRPLLASQEIGLGGIGFGRAFDFYERFGDSGVMAGGEFSWRTETLKFGVDRLQIFGFIDGGRVWNLENGFGGGDLASSGGGIRLTIGRTEIGAEIAQPIAQSGAGLIRTKPRVNLSISRGFR